MWILFDTILSRPACGSGSHLARMDRRRSSMEDHRGEPQDARSMGEIQIYCTSLHRYKPARSTANNRLLQICLGLQEDGNILHVAGKGHEQMEGHDPGGFNVSKGRDRISRRQSTSRLENVFFFSFLPKTQNVERVYCDFAFEVVLGGSFQKRRLVDERFCLASHKPLHPDNRCSTVGQIRLGIRMGCE